MAQPSRWHGSSPPQWLRRLDTAAAALNPVLTMLALGLVVLNVTCLFVLLSRLPVVHLSHQPTCAADAQVAPAPSFGAKGWTGY
jgi:hypothetical protein